MALQVHKSLLTVLLERSSKKKYGHYLDHVLLWFQQILRSVLRWNIIKHLSKHRKNLFFFFLLATPFKPILKASVIRMHNGEKHVILKCSTMRSKPPPQITWLFKNDIELYGKWRKCFFPPFSFLNFQGIFKCPGTLWWQEVSENTIQ